MDEERLYDHAERISAVETRIDNLEEKVSDLSELRKTTTQIALLQKDLADHAAVNNSLQKEQMILHQEVSDNLKQIKEIQQEQKEISKEFAKVVPALERLSRDVGEIRPKVARLDDDIQELKNGVKLRTEELKNNTEIKKQKIIMWTGIATAAIALIGTIIGFIF